MAFAINTSDAKNLRDAFLASFPTFEALRDWVAFNCSVNLNQIKQSNALPSIITDLFFWVEAGSTWKQFLSAGTQTVDLPLLSQRSAEILATFTKQQSAPTNLATQSILIGDGAPFVDRKTLWIDLVQVLNSNKKHSLVVDGPCGSGKSYCGDFLDHVWRTQWPTAQLALIDIKGEATPDFAPEELARRILFKLGVGNSSLPNPLPGQKPDRYARDLAAWLAGEIAQLNRQVWLVLDGFSNKQIREETIVLLLSLVEEAANKRDFRLVLIDFERTLSEQGGKGAQRSTLSHLTAQDITVFLAELDIALGSSAKAGWAAAQEFVALYSQLASGTKEQRTALAELLPQIVRGLV